MNVVVELQKSATPNVVLNQLYKHTPLQSSFGFNMLALVPVGEPRADGSVALEPQVLSLKQMLEHFIAHRKDVVTRRTRYDLRKAEERAHLLEGFRIALDNIDEVIEIVRGSQTIDDAKTKLSARFGLTDIQAQAIVDMRLRTLVGLERQKIEDEYAELHQDDRRAARHLAQRAPHRAIVKSETPNSRRRFGDERRTDVAAAEDEISMEQLIPNVDVVVTYTVGGYIKRVSVDTFRTQNRGGRGVIGISNLKREDVVRNFFVTKTHDHVLFFTNKGRVVSSARLRDSGHHAHSARHGARQPAHAAAGRRSDGGLPDRRVRGREVSRDGHATTASSRRRKLDEFANVRRNGLNAINLDEDDELLAVDLSDGTRDIILASSRGHGRALQRERRAPDGPQRARRQGDDARRRRHDRRDGRHRRRAQRSACSSRRRRSASARRSMITATRRAAARASRPLRASARRSARSSIRSWSRPTTRC